LRFSIKKGKSLDHRHDADAGRFGEHDPGVDNLL
jgi:hypothetical protein